MIDDMAGAMGLSAEQYELLARMLEGESIDLSRSQTIRPAPRPERVPLSFAQQRLWFLTRFAPDSPVYNVLVAARLEGALDAPAMGRALSEIVRRHESLRTTFPIIDGEPVQLVAAPSALPLPLTDLGGLPPREREEEMRRLASEEGEKPFDLERGPLFRVRLLRLSAREHVLTLAMHHIISDAWSMMVLVNELSLIYEAFSQGRPSPLPELPIQYADFAIWQREWLRDEVLQTQLDFWKRQLGEGPHVLDLPTDLPRPPVQGFRGAALNFTLPARLTGSLKSFSQREGVTLFMTLLAGCYALLHRYTGERRINIGSPIANRRWVETEGLIGFLTNTLVLRADTSGDPTFRELVGRVREMTVGAYAHQDLPFEKLVEELEPARDPRHTPLFQVLFTLQNPPVDQGKVTGLSMSLINLGNATAKFDLMFSLVEAGGGLNTVLEYNTEIFEAATVERMAKHLTALLESAAADPGRRLSDLTLLDPDERRLLLVEWSASPTDYPTRAVHRLVEEQAARDPEATAVSFRGARLAYGELNVRANRLARRLRRLGVGRETRVGVMADPGDEVIVGLLAMLKAGAAYVPLNTSDPHARLAYVLEDAGVSVLLTQRHLTARLPAHACAVHYLDDTRESDEESGENLPGDDAGPDAAAYVMYTSGSTGEPKGVVVPHGAVARLAGGADYVRLGPGEVVLQLAPLSFDASTFEVWGALANGARLDIFDGHAADLDALAAHLQEGAVTTLWLTAGLFHRMLDEHPEALAGVRQLLAGGDVLSPAHVARLLSSPGPGLLVNGYGPTENTTFTCCHTMRRGSSPARLLARGTVPVGRPVAGTRVYVLDSRLRPVPVGVAGELYAGGDGLARGYLGRPDLTADRFVPDPFGAEAGARLYRTGDRARWLSEGVVEFLGRADNQVKLRGFRVELGEIEAALGGHPSVQACAVMAREGAQGDRRLVAYVAGARGAAVPTAADLREFLKGRLPEYMVPNFFVVMDELPLTPNGKVNHRALPEPEQGQTPAADYAPPRTPVEEVLAGVWAPLLGVERVGAEDNFFDLGGHSLLATQVVSRVREVLRADVPLRLIFESPTLAAFARGVEQEMREAPPHAPPITRRPASGTAPPSFAQQRLWFFDQLEPGSTLYNVPAAVRLGGDLEPAVLERCFQEIVRRHESLRTTFAADGDQVVQVIAPEMATELPVLDLSSLPPDEREARAREEVRAAASRPFDLGRGPLLRTLLLRLSEREHVLAVVMHHIVTDGWSIGVMVRELSALYEAFADGRPSPLPELAVQYGDYAHWQREFLRGDALDSHLDYWKRRLTGAPAALELPFARPRPAAQSYRGAAHTWHLGQELTDALKELSRREGVTLFMTLLAAFKVLLHRYTGREDLLVGTDIANRGRRELEPLIGLFVNQLVLRTDLSGDPSFRLLLARAREATLEAYAHQDVPFDRLIKALNPERDLSRNPIFQVLFVLQNTPPAAPGLSGLTWEQLAVEQTGSKFDTALFMVETAEGLHGNWVYSTDLFDAGRVAAMAADFQALLTSAAARPDARLSEMEMPGAQGGLSAGRGVSPRQMRSRTLGGARQRAAPVSAESLVRREHLAPGLQFPLVFRPAVGEVDAAGWARSNRRTVEEHLSRHGALLFRGFGVRGVAEFEQVAAAVCPNLYGEYGDLPREELSGRVYGATPYAADRPILFHNESSHLSSWPSKIFFHCVKAARGGGETPLVDCRRVYQAMSDGLRESFLHRQLLYVRNFTDGLDVSWQDFFRTTDRSKVEEQCRADSVGFEWKRDGGLRISQRRPAVIRHPSTGEMTFFNQIFLHHTSRLRGEVRDSLRSLYREEDLPRNVYYGDGSPIEDGVVDELEGLYDGLAVAFPWEEGDVLLLDNMLVAHARRPFVGERKIVVALGDLTSDRG